MLMKYKEYINNKIGLNMKDLYPSNLYMVNNECADQGVMPMICV